MFGMNSRITLKNVILIFRSIQCSKSISIICLKAMSVFQNMGCSSVPRVERKRCGSRLRTVPAKNQEAHCLLLAVSRQTPQNAAHYLSREDRVYLTGLSMGGRGTFLMEIPARDPGYETQFLSHPFVEGMGILALDH